MHADRVVFYKCLNIAKDTEFANTGNNNGWIPAE